MNITAKPCRMRDVIAGDSYYSIPDYQRPYEWTAENVEDFWTDLGIRYINVVVKS